MHFQEHIHCFMQFLASKHCFGRFWAPPSMCIWVTGLGHRELHARGVPLHVRVPVQARLRAPVQAPRDPDQDLGLPEGSPGRVRVHDRPVHQGRGERSRSQLHFKLGGAENLSILAVNALAVNVLAVNSVS